MSQGKTQGRHKKSTVERATPVEVAEDLASTGIAQEYLPQSFKKVFGG